MSIYLRQMVLLDKQTRCDLYEQRRLLTHAFRRCTFSICLASQSHYHILLIVSCTISTVCAEFLHKELAFLIFHKSHKNPIVESNLDRAIDKITAYAAYTYKTVLFEHAERSISYLKM